MIINTIRILFTSSRSIYSSHKERQATGSKNVISYGVSIFLEPDKVSPKSCLCLRCLPVLLQYGRE